MGPVHKSYTAKEKLTVIAYAEVHGNRAAQREFNINEKNVRRWRNEKEDLLRQKKTRRANRGKQAAYPKLEESLLQFVTERRSQGIGVEVLGMTEGEQIINFFDSDGDDSSDFEGFDESEIRKS